MYGWTDGRTDGQTDPLIEMCSWRTRLKRLIAVHIFIDNVNSFGLIATASAVHTVLMHKKCKFLPLQWCKFFSCVGATLLLAVSVGPSVCWSVTLYFFGTYRQTLHFCPCPNALFPLWSPPLLTCTRLRTSVAMHPALIFVWSRSFGHSKVRLHYPNGCTGQNESNDPAHPQLLRFC